MPNRTKQTIHNCICEICKLHPYSKTAKQHQAINRVILDLNERNKRRFAGVLAIQWGRGSILQLSQITGLSRNTIDRGRSEVKHPRENPASGIRRSGAGRPLIEKNNQVY